MKRFLAIIFLFSMSGINGVQAGCEDRSTQMEMNKCAADASRVSEQKMKNIYRGAIKAQQDTHKKALRKAQRSWIAYRDNACLSYSLLTEGGTLRPTLFYNCLSQLTSERIKMLEFQTAGLGN